MTGTAFGPQAPNASTSLPTPLVNLYGIGVDTWVRDASGSWAQDGTVLNAQFFNAIIGNLRQAVRDANVPLVDGDMTMLSRAIEARAASEAAAVFGSTPFSWGQIRNPPTTWEAYGITDVAPLAHVGAGGAAHALATQQSAGFLSTADKAKIDALVSVATTGDYNTLINTPVLAAVATSGSASDITRGTLPPSQLPVATTGALGGVQIGSNLTVASGVLSLLAANVVAALTYTPLSPANALSELTSVAGTARTNLGLGSLSTLGVGAGLSTSAGNLVANVQSVAGQTGAIGATALKAALGITTSDVSGLGGAATLSVGTGAGTVAAGNDSRIVNAVQSSALAAANGVATLDSSGKLSTSQIPASLVGALQYQGAWNASTNTPALASGAGTKGAMYKVSVAGATTLDGISQWAIGDYAVYNGTSWDKFDGAAYQVQSVAGLVGSITSAALKTALGIAATDVSGLGSLATLGYTTGLYSSGGLLGVSYGTTAGTAAQGNDSRITGALQASTAASTYAPLTGSGTSGTWPISVSGNAATASAVAWGNVTGRPTAVSAFANDAGYLTSSALASYAALSSSPVFSGGNITSSNTAGAASLYLNPMAGTQSSLYFQDGGTTKWQVGKQGDNTFFVYDAANGRSALTISAADIVNFYATPNIGGTSISSLFAPITMDSVSALAAYTVPAPINTILLSGYAAAGDMGAALYLRVATPSTIMPWHHQSADGAWWRLNVTAVTPFHFGAVGNNSTDDWLAAQTAINYAQAFLKKMWFPRANYVFSKMLTVSVPIDITSDPSATMRWTNAPSVTLPTVSSITVSGRTATITFASAHGLVVNQRIILIGFTPNRYGDEARSVLTVPSSTTVTVDVPPDIGNMTAAGTAKAMDAALPTVSSITVSGTTATVTFASAHGLTVGQSVLLAGFTSTNFNSTFTILTVPSTTTATFKIASGTGNASVIGKAFLRNDGLLIDLRDSGSSFGLNNIELPQLYSSGVSSAFTMESYPTTWAGLGRIGDAITLWGGSRIAIRTQYVAGWGSRVNIEGTSDATNGLVSPENIDVFGNTDDLNIMGIKINGGPNSSDSLGPIAVVSNTSFAKYPVFIRSNNGAVNELSVRINQVFTNETNGAGVYEDGSGTNGSEIDFAWIYAGKGGDSPTGTSSTLTLPYVAGSNSSNGSTTDGATVGYFGGNSNVIRMGYAWAFAAQPGAYPPGAGYATRIRVCGAYNEVKVTKFPISAAQTAVASTTQGETNYNGGVGGAGFAPVIVVQVTVPTLAAGASTAFYFYHTNLSKGMQVPVQVVPVTNALNWQQYQVVAGDDTASVNREGYIFVKNNTGSTITGGTFYLWVKVGL